MQSLLFYVEYGIFPILCVWGVFVFEIAVFQCMDLLQIYTTQTNEMLNLLSVLIC